MPWIFLLKILHNTILYDQILLTSVSAGLKYSELKNRAMTLLKTSPSRLSDLGLIYSGKAPSAAT